MKHDIRLSRKATEFLCTAIEEWNISHADEKTDEMVGLHEYFMLRACEDDPRLAIGFTYEEARLMKEILECAIDDYIYSLSDTEPQENIIRKTLAKIEIITKNIDDSDL